VVEVRVGDEDRVDAQVELVDGMDQAVGLVAGIDDDRAVGALGAR